MKRKKDKVVLVTIEDKKNYGNRLQHYALQMVIEQFNFTVESLMVLPPPSSILIRKAKEVGRRFFALMGSERMRHRMSVTGREEAILAFNRRHLSKIIRIPIDQIWQTNWDCYKYAITGSDQVWHNWHNISDSDELPFYYLTFFDKNRRISYAPSFGFHRFPDEDIEMHRKGLSEIKALSCREKEGCNLIKELTDREATKVLDPTLLLTKEEWEMIERRPCFSIPGDYILLFFLGGIPLDYQDEIDRLKDDYQLIVIDINEMSEPKHFAISPEEFIWIIHHAAVVCTDSFHASVFAIIFGTKLRVFRRTGEYSEMFARLSDLLEPLGLMKVVYGEGNDLATELSEDARFFLLHKKKESLDYLKDSLNTYDLRT